jgi:ABC-type transport system involved in multi-copper enzyme maturation permease subunit
MFAIARSLMWKEWREQRWKVAAMTALLLVVTLLASRGEPMELRGTLAWAGVTILPFLALFLAMTIAASERLQNTLGLMQSLPTPLPYAATVKLVVAVFTLSASLFLAAAIVVGLERSTGLNMRDHHNNSFVDTFNPMWRLGYSWSGSLFLVLGCALSMLLWCAAAGVNQVDEIRAGAIGFLSIAGVWALLLFVPMAFDYDPHLVPGWRWLAVAAPGGVLAGGAPGQVLPKNWWQTFDLRLIWVVSVHVALAIVYVWRFGRVSSNSRAQVDVTAANLSAKLDWLPPPRRSPLKAMLWKQYRESFPLAALGSGLIVIFALITFRQFNNFDLDVKSLVIQLWCFVSVFICLVAGVGAFMEDYQPGVPAFWRSRPIPLRKYFMVKYLGGLTITLVILSFAPLVLVVLGTYLFGTGRDPAPVKQTYLMIEFTVLMLIGIYTAASASFVLSRRPLPTALLAVGSVWLACLAIGEIGTTLPKGAINLLVLSVPPILVGIILAYHAFRNDWGWRK